MMLGPANGVPILANEGPVNADLLAYEGSVYVALPLRRFGLWRTYSPNRLMAPILADRLMTFPNLPLRDATSRLF
jgi:hypothetical protein